MSESRFWIRAAAACMVAAPLGIGIANLLGLNQTGTDAATLAWVAQHPARYFWAVVIFLLGLGLLIVAGVRVAMGLSQRAARLAVLGGVSVCIGGFAAIVTMSTYLLSARLISLPGVDPSVALVIKEKGDEDGGLGLFILLALLLYVGLILLAVGLHRASLSPSWAAGLIGVGAVAGVVVDVTGASTVIVELATVPLLVGFAVVARQSLTGWQGDHSGRRNDAAPAAHGHAKPDQRPSNATT